MRPSNPPSPGGAFRVDLDDAAGAISDLERARDELKSIADQAQALSKVDPGSGDSVSIEAAALLGAVAAPGPGSLVAALSAGIAQVEELIQAMRTDLAEHQETDSGVASSFRS